ncbi:MAG TPA: 5-deoxy-glucuronate isomerase [Candidatus Blautia faecavium]|uniref:5-deoxy-glucuronate isomerase n=1 Tax=Candidatus Blautia faecavium TaxID=2838487 RepID=A0A9D2RX96_9FIRM|nr:5-deoxy-glucuronate isomerase [Candidatus Blautia faecavium]
MTQVFGYPSFDEKGEKILTTYDNAYKEMGMDIRVYRIHEGETRRFFKEEEEMAVLLLEGEITYKWDEKEQKVSRSNVFDMGPWCLHVCQETEILVRGDSGAEILVQCTKNQQKFPSRLYAPKDAPWIYSCQGKFGNTANRRVNTIFDHDIAPYSNMVLGEVLNDRGNWSGYLPHRHPQPEVYYFKFDRPEGFGASFVGDEVYKSTDGSFSAIPGGKLHPQAAAPGFQMYTCWMIHHLEGNPWLQTDRCEDERYLWLHEAEF